jgi:PAS domain S-box-containing protein
MKALKNVHASTTLAEKGCDEWTRAVVQAIPDSIFLLDADLTYLECWPKSTCRCVIPPEELRGKNMRAVLPAALAEKFAHCFKRATETGELQVVEYDFPSNGETRYSEARIVHTADGKYLAVVRDITERRQAEEKLKERDEELQQSHTRIRELARRVMAAHEEERMRISRELQDDLNQKVATLSIAANSIRNEPSVPPDMLQRQLDLLKKCAHEIAEGLRMLSGGLHPAVLDHAGLAAALRAYVSEFSSLENIQIRLNLPDEVRAIPPEAAICLYRVAQESLRNVARHAGTNEAEITLSLFDNSIQLDVADFGMGFDVEVARKNGGLGLASMEERIGSMRGRLEILTRPGRGSKLVAIIPLENSDSQRGGA